MKPTDEHETIAMRRIRIERGLTIEHLAHLAGVSKSTISKAENGRHKLTPTTVVILARALKVSPKRLISSERKA